jgi:hypothetical protein
VMVSIRWELLFGGLSSCYMAEEQMVEGYVGKPMGYSTYY